MGEGRERGVEQGECALRSGRQTSERGARASRGTDGALTTRLSTAHSLASGPASARRKRTHDDESVSCAARDETRSSCCCFDARCCAW